MAFLPETAIEQTLLARLRTLGYQIKHDGAKAPCRKTKI